MIINPLNVVPLVHVQLSSPPAHTYSTEVTEVRIALPHGQKTGTMLSLTGASTAAASWEPVGAVGTALTELLTEVVCLDTNTGVVTGLSPVLAGLVVVLVASRASKFGLDLAMILGP